MSAFCLECGHTFTPGEGRYLNICVSCFDGGRVPTSFGEASRDYARLRAVAMEFNIPIITAVQSSKRALEETR